jgi:hypothetical protein
MTMNPGRRSARRCRRGHRSGGFLEPDWFGIDGGRGRGFVEAFIGAVDLARHAGGQLVGVPSKTMRPSRMPITRSQ